MIAIRQLLISTLLFAAVPTAAVYGASAPVQYVGGTVKSIPVNSTGSFNFEDAKDFRFAYNGSVYKLPYDQITSTSASVSRSIVTDSRPRSVPIINSCCSSSSRRSS